MPSSVADVWPPKGPKLLLHKPPKGQLKKAKGSQPPSSAPPPSMDSSSSSSAPPPPSMPKKPFLRRIFPLLLAVNFAIGAYILTRTTKKPSPEEKDEAAVAEVPSSTPGESSPAVVPEKASPIQSIPVPVRVPPAHISEDDQREIFKWILEEKRKIKTRDPVERKKIDEEKAILKQYIRSESIPSI